MSHLRGMRIGFARHGGGFSLIEVMVAVIVLCVGLLGIAKMQALALSSTSIAGERALAAILAESLAASMHENRAFWTTTAAGVAYTVTGNVVNNPPVAPPNCLDAAAGTCNATALAAFDLQQWAIALGGGTPAGSLTNQPALLPNPTAQVSCNTVNPVSCTVQISWAEKAVALSNASAANQNAAMQNPTYILYVQP